MTAAGAAITAVPEAHADEAVGLLQELVSTASTNPPGDIREVASGPGEPGVARAYSSLVVDYLGLV